MPWHRGGRCTTQRVGRSAAGRTQRCSMPCFLTLAFLILFGNQAGPPAGLSTIEMLPVKTWTRLVPRSRRRMVSCPRVAAFKAAPRGCLLANTWLVSFPFSMRTKYFFPSDIWISSVLPFIARAYNTFPKKRHYCATYGPQSPFPNPKINKNGRCQSVLNRLNSCLRQRASSY